MLTEVLQRKDGARYKRSLEKVQGQFFVINDLPIWKNWLKQKNVHFEKKRFSPSVIKFDFNKFYFFGLLEDGMNTSG